MAKEPRSEKMYKESPSLKRGEDGKVGVSKPEKKAAGAAGGGDGAEKHILEMEQKHAKERMDLYHKHESEHLSLMQKHRPAGGKDMKEGSMGGETAEKKGEADKGGKTEDKKEG